MGNTIRDAKEMYKRINQLPRCCAALLVDPKSKDEMYNAIRNLFLEPLSRKPPDLVIIFYAGHGVQIGTKLSVIPARAEYDDETDCESKCIWHLELFRWLKTFLDEKAKNLAYESWRSPARFLLSFDMCRDNFGAPANSFSCEPECEGAPLHWSVCLSTSRGAMAQDGEEHGHSPFASELLDDTAVIFAPGRTLKQGIETACQRVFQKIHQQTV